MASDPMHLKSPADWKIAMHKRLSDSGMSRYKFVRNCQQSGVCTVHTAECLLANEGTETGKRVPTLKMAIEMAELAGMSLVLVPANLTA